MNWQGIPAFLMDCYNDDKLDLIEAEFGDTGFTVVVKLWRKIYSGNGYYCEWNDDVALTFANKNNKSVNVVSEIVKASLRRDIFNADLYKKYGILTSRGIQRRYFEVVRRRKGVEVKSEYLLIDVASKFKNVNILGQNADIFNKNADIFQTSKGKESKGKESKEVGFEKPTHKEVQAYITENGYSVNASKFISHYESNGWKVGQNSMVDWKAAVDTWQLSEPKHHTDIDATYNLEEIERKAMYGGDI